MLINTELEFLFYFIASITFALECVDTVEFLAGRSGSFRIY